MYDCGRYFTVTGNRLDYGPSDLMTRTEELREVHALVFGQEAIHTASTHYGGTDRERALMALAGLSKHRAIGYSDWLAVGMALHSVDPSESMLEIWDSWSKSCVEKYVEGACARKWRSFRGSGLGLASLIYWAKQDGGWNPPCKPLRGFGGANGALRNGGEVHHEEPKTGYEIILDFFQEKYRPLFRRGFALFSEEGREITMKDALAGAPIELIHRLELASDVPQFRGGGVNRARLPHFFSTWGKSSFVDLVDMLPEEEDEGTAQESGAGKEEFSKKIATILHSIVSLGTSLRNGSETKIERRSLLNFCEIWAKKYWGQIRSYLMWCRRNPQLEVAIRLELFGQLSRSDLAKISPTKFTQLCEKYSIGRGTIVGGKRVVVLSHDFLAEHLTIDRMDKNET
jgi:hypothetical protein